MEIKDLSSLKRHVGSSNNTTSGKDQQAETNSSNSNSSSATTSTADEVKVSTTLMVEPTFGGSRCKLFELAECDDCRVFLAYQLQPDQDEPSVWLHSSITQRWYQLADSFSKYFRMMLVHLGLPLWQICAAGLQLPTWLEQVYSFFFFIEEINAETSGRYLLSSLAIHRLRSHTAQRERQSSTH